MTIKMADRPECPVCSTFVGEYHLPGCPMDDNQAVYVYDAAPEPEYVPLVEILGNSKAGGVWV